MAGKHRSQTTPMGKGNFVRRPSFAEVLAAPIKSDRIALLEATFEKIQSENTSLKMRISTLEARLDSLVKLVIDKAKDVETKVQKEAQEATTLVKAKVQECVDAVTTRETTTSKECSQVTDWGSATRMG